VGKRPQRRSEAHTAEQEAEAPGEVHGPEDGRQRDDVGGGGIQLGVVPARGLGRGHADHHGAPEAHGDAPQPAQPAEWQDRGGKREREARREQVRAAHAAWVRAGGLGPVDAVPPVLARQGGQAVARDVLRAHLRETEDAPAAAADARGELRVLVVVPVLVPAAVRLEHRARPHAGEAAVHLDLSAARLPELRATPAQRRLQRQRHTAGPGAVAAGQLRAADVVGAAAAQALDAAREVVLGVERVRVHPRDVGAARVREADVEAHGRRAHRVLENAYARIRPLQLEQDLAGPVLGSPVDEQELDRSVEVLSQHLRRDLPDVVLLVEDGRKDAHVNRHVSPPSRSGLSGRRTRPCRRG
jgi:hypothetical protein